MKNRLGLLALCWASFLFFGFMAPAFASNVAGLGGDVGTRQSTPTPTATPSHTMTTLPIIVQLTGQSFAAAYTAVARPTDGGLISQGNLWLLPFISIGTHTAVYTSWAKGQTVFPPNSTQFTIFCYNPEHWTNTPQSEQDNLVATVQQASATVHALGNQFMVVPDQSFDQSYLSQMAPFVDVYGLQGERFENDWTKFNTYIPPEITAIRAANPKAKVYLQVGTQFGDAQVMYDTASLVAGQIDGIMVWTSPGSLATVQQFLAMVRPAN